MRTALAVVAAIALVAGALYVRTSFIEGDQPGQTGTVAGDQAGIDPVVVDQSAPVVACDARLGTACPSGSDVMDLDQLLAAFQADPIAHEVLVAPSAVAELIEQSRTSRATFAEDRQPVALTPLVVATAASLDEVVAEACATATWACVADLVQVGALTPAITDPVRTSTGLAALAALTGGFFGTPHLQQQRARGIRVLHLDRRSPAAGPRGHRPPERPHPLRWCAEHRGHHHRGRGARPRRPGSDQRPRRAVADPAGSPRRDRRRCGRRRARRSTS